MMRARAALLIVSLSLLAGCAEKPKDMCAAWHCHEQSSAPLAWTRPPSENSSLDISSSGDLCPRHAKRTPFALTGRFFLVFGIVPALFGGYAVFRILYVFDQYGPGLPRLVGEQWGKPVIFGVPVLASILWMIVFVVRAW